MPRSKAIDHDNPEWTKEDFAKARPASELPAHIRAAFPRTRGPQKAAKKTPVSIRLSPEVIEYFKAGGPGWQSRIDEVLRNAAGV
ncbi:BrnA antitoxin family protein [Paracoccus aminovorans]|uniref:BrnA antitoxin family protein n=1 Tax=Paracoccus aminovorans TaxID=34004 RepID=UPI002B258BE9|nr:BrnA antitoxin family protein [Paracoccus aminovorans]